MSKFTSKQTVLAAFALLSALVGWAPSALGQSAAENIRPVAKVCLAGQSCVGSMAGGAKSTASAPVAEAVQEVVAEVVSEVVEAAAPMVAAVASDFDAAAKYQMSCFACHGTGAAGAPKLDDAAEWETRMAKGMDAVMANVINGIQAMPPKGLCMDCSDDNLLAIVEYMISQ